MLKGDEGRLLKLVGGAEYLRLFTLFEGFEEGAKESLRASDNSAMLRL